VNKRRNVWRRADQPPRHHRQVEVSHRAQHVPTLAVKVGATSGADALREVKREIEAHMQTEAFWRKVWSD
jgi:hypothetical protein